MNASDLVGHFSRVWHVAEDGSLASIMKHGLLSTTALLDFYGLEGEERRALESRRRPESVTITRKGLPAATIRDQKPMTESALQKCLTGGLTPAEWLKILNARVFFWLSRERLRGLLAARAYRARPHTVLTVDTATLVQVHRNRIELSPINTGSTIYRPMPRGPETFQGIEDYPFDEHRKKKTVEKSVVELSVLGSVPDIADHLIAAHRVHNGQKTELWRRAGAAPDEGP